ncbi:MAG: OOP family OmpA-OmpF porin [Saprospiraceae bacterium]|jgi:OOP family OmpA-OmpF porin
MLGNKDNASYLDNLGDLIGGGNLAHNDPKDAAGGFLNSLFGDKMGGIIDLVSSIAGVKKSSSSSSLFGMVAPMIMGYVGKKIMKEGLSTLGLASFLGSQGNNIASAMPNQLADMIGFDMPGGLAEKAASTVKDSAADKVVDTVADTAKSGGNMLMKILPLLLLGIVGLFAWKQCGNDVKNAGEKIVDVVGVPASSASGAISDATKVTVDAAGNAVDAAGNAIASLGDFFKRKLVNGIELNIPEFGVESKLLNVLDDAKSGLSEDEWYDFYRITFASGSASLDINKSQEQLSNIAKIMKACPNMNIKIGGYTDNTGDEAANLTLFEARVNAVKKAIANLGVEA